MSRNAQMRQLLRSSIDEDGGLHGDVTTNSISKSNIQSAYKIVMRSRGIVAGLELLSNVIDEFGDVTMELLCADGEEKHSEPIAILRGTLPQVLVAERIILNILGHACGIATRTKQFVELIEGFSCVVCDTRKTTPGLRFLEKYAVVCGGGTSHRMGLHDAALYKDNHIASMKDISVELSAAIEKVRLNTNLQFVEVEVDTLEQLDIVLKLDVDIILLDNMSLEMLRQAVAKRDEIKQSILLEASGSVNENTVRLIAESGVDRISIGGLTHQSVWVDIGLDVFDV